MSADTVAPVETTKTIFRKLKSLPENKVCFDCPAKNPSWCTIPYGAYVCLECSGVHRSLGTHLTFIRSSDLDGAWTWKQLRCMQVGGNAKARAFFRANGGDTDDKAKKYSSRAATLYKSKIEKLALDAVRKYAGETHIGAVSTGGDDGQAKNRHDDFFGKFDNADLKQTAPVPAQVKQEAIIVTEKPHEPEKTLAEVSNGMDKLSVNLEATTKPAVKAVKVSKLGAKKTGKKSAFGGAKKVDKTAFKNASSAAERVEKEEKVVQKMDAGEASLSTEAAARLTYKQIERDQKKASANLTGKKAESAARLGMGFGGMRTVTHDSDFQEIRQVEASTTFKEPSIMDDESMGSFSRRKEETDDLADLYAARKNNASSITEEKSSTRGMMSRDSNTTKIAPTSASFDSKKYQGAKAISSADLFGDEPVSSQSTPQSRLNQFSGASGVGSSDIFGNGNSNSASYSGYNIRDQASDMAGNAASMAGSALSAGWNAFNKIKHNYS